MEVWAVSIMVLLTVAVVWGFCYLVARRYIDVREKNALTIFAATVALSLTLLTMLLVPVDIYIVSSDLTSDGLQTNPDLVNNSAEGIKYIYYVMYILLIVFAFGIMPFAYFWFEEDGEDISPRKRAFEAGKYTAGFIIIFVVLLTLGIVLKKNVNSKNEENQWQNTLSNTFDETDSIISFCICTLAIFGLAGWIFYTAYGLAAIPILLLRRAGPVVTKKEANLEMKRRKVEEEIKFLSSKYGQNDKWTKKDESEYNRLKRENERLNQIQDTTPLPKEDVCSRVWNSFAPVRIVLSLCLLGVSLLIVISILLSTIDRFQHSDCGYSCGYALTSASMWNPIDMAMVTFEKVFPIDYLFFGALICYLLICTINGLSNLGVRCLCWQLYEVRKGMTPPNGLLFGFWLVMMNMLALNLQLTTLAPQYSVYGRQFYYDWAINSSADNTTNFLAPSLIDTSTASLAPTTSANAVINALRQRSNLFATTLDPILVAETNFTQNYTADDCPNAPGCYRTSDKMDCTVKVDNRTGQCVATQIGVFINTVNVQLPFFGTILLCGNVFFLAAYFIFALLTLCRGARPPAGYKKLGGKEDLWNGET